MISSMTGYGRCEVLENERKVMVEISSVNHRYLDLNIKMPKPLMYLEDGLRKKIKEKVARGKVEVMVTYQSASDKDFKVTVNEALGNAYIEGLRQFGRRYGVADDLKLSDLVAIDELITMEKQSPSEEAVAQLLEAAIEGALDQFMAMRQREGSHLAIDLLTKNSLLKEVVSQLEAKSPQVVIHYKERLEARLKELLHAVPVDETRLAMEVALFTDKCAIDEELTRLKSHMTQLEHIIKEGGTCGRKLDFLMQEMNREANTIGSKANDHEITKMVVTLKTEMEKIREQVQNIE